MSLAASETPKVSWQLWSNDYFDRDAPPFLEMEGEGIVEGFIALWQNTLEEGVQDNGRTTFTGFTLQSQQGQFILPRDPLMNSELARLRMWRGHPGLLETLAKASAARPDHIGDILKAAAEAASPGELCEVLLKRYAGAQVPPEQPAGCLCDSCGTRSVIFVREDPPGFQLFRCSSCHEVKRWCPRCGQGWLVHFIVDDTPRSRYICDECRTVWDSRWNCLTPEGVAYVASEVMGSNPVEIRDIEKYDEETD